MSGLGPTIDPLQQMELENKKTVVEHDKLKDKARKALDEAMRKALPDGLKKAQVLPLVFYPDDRLTTVVEETIPEAAFKTKLLKKLTDDMLFTMYMCGGVGLAGPQVGYMKRVFVCDWSEDRKHPVVCINPEVISGLNEFQAEAEACLSFPGVRLPVMRSTRIEARWHDARGKLFEMELDGWAARIFQHEHDHLDGRTVLAQASRLERRQALKKLDKIARGEAKPGPKPKRKKKRRRR